MATIPPPEWIDAMKPSILCGSCVAGVPVREVMHNDAAQGRPTNREDAP